MLTQALVDVGFVIFATLGKSEGCVERPPCYQLRRRARSLPKFFRPSIERYGVGTQKRKFSSCCLKVAGYTAAVILAR